METIDYNKKFLDFISQKECNETIYWLELLQATGYISNEQFDSLYEDAKELLRLLSASIVKIKKNRACAKQL